MTASLRAMATILALWATQASAAAPGAPVGNWLTQDRDAVIAIAPCGTALCGQLVGLPLDHPTDPIPTDYQNHSQCHLTILRNALQDGADWNGQILDPRDGKVYRIRLSLDEHRNLRARGYVGIPLFGSTQTWTPFTSPVPADCRLPPRSP